MSSHTWSNHQIYNVMFGAPERSGDHVKLPVTGSFTVWRLRNGFGIGRRGAVVCLAGPDAGFVAGQVISVNGGSSMG